ncbi:MAG: serine O-acetyltransferase [Christensenellales bacterium]|nr:serine O-acetyltransferase [Christensenellales bacterium]
MNHNDIIGNVIQEMQSSGRVESLELPQREAIVRIINDLQRFMFPAFTPDGITSDRMILEQISLELQRQIHRALKFCKEPVTLDPKEVTLQFINEIPNIYRMLKKDIEALYDGDPAATCNEEIIAAYPGFFAIKVYRIAHVLYQLKIPIIPRIMTEYVHEHTGIDIHAGAQIGEYFFIDHGTGIVIGETTVIGHHVKLYQGVTLGAKSFELDEDGNPVKGIKRHPNIGNYVIIYANATVLGGNTCVGDHCVIGGNVWLTHSLEDHRVVVYKDLNEHQLI